MRATSASLPRWIGGLLAADRAEPLPEARIEIDPVVRQALHTLVGRTMDPLGLLPAAGDRFAYGALQFELVDMDRIGVDCIPAGRSPAGAACA